jgi:hypothetical protein
VGRRFVSAATAVAEKRRLYQLRQTLLSFLVLQPHTLLHGFFALRDDGWVDGGFEALKDLWTIA